MDLFAEMRRDHESGEGIKALARKYKVHRRMVREALRSGLPAERKKPERSSPKLEPYVAWIEAILGADEKAPRKQRHSAQRIWTRLRQEFPQAAIGESTVRHYIDQCGS